MILGGHYTSPSQATLKRRECMRANGDKTAKQRLLYFHLEGPHRDEAALLGDLVGNGVELSLALLGDDAAPENKSQKWP